MKHCKKIVTLLLAVAVLLTAAAMTGCTKTEETPGSTPSDVETPDNTPSGTETQDEPQTVTLPILDEIDETVTVGTAGSSLLAVQAAAKLLDWGVNTGLDTEEIGAAAAAWLGAKGDAQDECLKKLEMVDSAYQQLLTDEARNLLDTAGCADTEITWGSDPAAPVEAIMQAMGLRG